MSNIKTVCVFCGSSPGVNPIYIQETNAVGASLVSNGLGIVYGGGNKGIMGAIAESVQSAGGKVLGIIPEAMIVGFPEMSLVGETITVPDMHTRKAMMNAKCEAFVALPGGLGTFEEVLEAMTWSQLGIHAKPIIILNTNGFYEPLRNLIDRGVAEGFILKENREIAIFVDTAAEVVPAILSYKVPSGRHSMPWNENLI
ncbi:hypothetical protein HDU78_003565 [Chytriomyces hyalinus]|nr:hypothetical protein HDU78_003565 [Chytriomyces hyalinus]KAJ3258135.1 hypothetical protein HDU77_002416 [Chytriomyces hyalinus]KAJ3393705.1 hypothetical protein HDU80_010659 [Chytriomyces hyalinus]